METNKATITINGRPLSVGQAMTIRVALSNMMMDLEATDSLGDDEHGRRMTELYRERAREILALMSP